MAEYPLTQSTWGRAKQDTQSVFHTIRFWVVEMISAPIVALGMYLAIPNSASTAIKTLVPIAAFSIWMLAVLVGVFLLSLAVAPYRQRNQARTLLQAKPKPIPISNRDELLRAISDVQMASGKFLMAQEQLDDLQARSPKTVPIDAINTKSGAHTEYEQAMNKLEAEKMVAGKPFESLLSDLIVYISTQIWMKEAKPIIYGGKPEPLGFRTALATFGRMASRISKAIQEINELTGQVPDNEDSQT